MIRDLFIISGAGLSLYHTYFGQCHSVSANADLFSGLISAIQMFCKEISGSNIRHLEMDERKMVFHNHEKLLYALVSEMEDSIEFLSEKIRIIAELFQMTYDKFIKEFTGNIEHFNDFGDILIEKGITKENCGKHPNCSLCQNNENLLPIVDCINAIEGYCED